MPDSVLLPALGESVTEGTVTRWLKAVGELVAIDEPLVEVSTDKVDTEIPSPFAGILQSIEVAEDQIAEIGAVLAIIGSESAVVPVETPTVVELGATAARDPLRAGEQGEPLGSETPAAAVAPPADRDSLGDFPANRPQAASASLTSPTETPAPPVAETKSPGLYFTPLVRRLARQHKVDLATVAGTGVGGRVRGDDVRKAAASTVATPSTAVVAVPAPAKAAAPAPATLRGTVVKAPRIRAVIASRMRESLNTSTQLTQVHEVDVTAIVRLRERTKGQFAAVHGVKLTFLPFIAQAVAEALKAHPMLNAEFDEAAGNITYHGAEHLAFAVDAPKGLMVPVVRDAGSLNLAGLASGIADVAARTRNGSIKAEELNGGTFSITNIGSVGALFDTPIINQPQVGILGVGAIVKRPMVVAGADGEDVIAIRHMMYLCLTYDHRLVDGADAGRFLQTVSARLSAGAFEAELGL
ncbi:2-oxoglutarate dehydrogenase, E2 component, dihydrolipoamide succinyltransferase [Arthrobacter sp. HY1533]|uniref:2-oxoglutarate dehydrogenase, E2 component, dihydrolipoamide succinyltransferase n=1 Tax=Arthrobacter sp. HY1533 TaxID=2970919 RepID=UPI0022BA10E2|nr:2-oxoglutarate dehydrogenase, E2 component, dihydrolipoamide succinyltransferase [Arthrobacter sp. HY1533]